MRFQLHRKRLVGMLIRVASYGVAGVILVLTGTPGIIAAAAISVIAVGVAITTEPVLTRER